MFVLSLAFSSHCKTDNSAGSATEKRDERNVFRTRNLMSVSHYQTFKHYQSAAKRSQNGCSDATSSAVLPAAITSSLIYVIRVSLINLETLKYIFKNLQLKRLHFQASLSRTAWTDINNKLLI